MGTDMTTFCLYGVAARDADEHVCMFFPTEDDLLAMRVIAVRAAVVRTGGAS